MQDAKIMIDLIKSQSQLLKSLIKKVERIDTRTNINRKHLTTQEACRFLGCERTYLWRLVKAGKLTRIKLENGRTHYITAELTALIENPVDIEDAA